MVYNYILAMHLAGALLTALISAYALFAVYSRKVASYRRLAQFLGAVATFEIASGVLMAVLSVQLKAVALCSNLAWYLTFVALVELVLFREIKKTSIAVPTLSVTSPVLSGLGLMCIAIVLGI